MKRRHSVQLVSSRYQKAPRRAPVGQSRAMVRKKACCDAELKNIDTAFVTPLFPNNGTSGSWSTPILLNNIIVGGFPQQRQGRKVDMKSILFRCSLSSALAANTQIMGQLRVLIVYDRQTNGAVPVQADIVASPNFTETPLNLSNAERFTVLMDTFNNTEGAIMGLTAQSVINFLPQYRKMNNKPMLFKDTSAGNVTDITKGAIWLMYATNLTNTSSPSATMVSRIRYTDS